MTQKDFEELVDDLEIMVLEHMKWPLALVIDPEYVKSAYAEYPGKRFTHYKLRYSAEVVPILEGKKGQFFIKPGNPK